jgi:ABC-type proline/glycine betaine transport system permease subunit
MTPKMQLLFEQLPDLLGGHLTLAVPAIFMGVLISVPLGILCVKSASNTWAGDVARVACSNNTEYRFARNYGGTVRWAQ